MLSRTERGCLTIADISGYTGYLTTSELDHAHDILADLMGTVVGAVRPVLRLVKLEGDAAFAYAPAGKVDGSALMDVVEGCYFTFQRRLRDIRQATSCECNACLSIPTLNLKFFAHEGEFVRHRIAGHEDLTGTDVIVVHRLLKNTVAETFGLNGYGLFTAACVTAMGVDPAALGLREHSERYDHVGEVRVHIQDPDTRVTWRIRLPRGRKAKETWEAMREPMAATFQQGAARMAELLAAERARAAKDPDLPGPSPAGS